MRHLSSPRGLALITTASALLGGWALAERSLLSIPLSVVFVVAAFAWSLSRFSPDGLPVPGSAGTAPIPIVQAPRVCAGCVAGCVGCRERLDAA